MSRTVGLALGLLVLALAALSVLLPFGGLMELARQDPDLARTVATELRLPRAVLACLYGAVLGATGAAVQALFANPLSSPDITGTTGGAALGAVVTAYLIGVSSPLGLGIGAVAGAGLTLAALLLIAGPRAETATLLLAGLAISASAGALTTLALALAPSPFAFYDAFDWLLGSLVDRSLPQAAAAGVPALVVLAMLMRERNGLDRLALGEEVAESLGDRLAPMRLRIVALTTLGIGACVAVCGAIGFIGLVAPIFARRLTRGHPGQAILPAALVGAALLLAADLIVRAGPLGRSIPVGVVTALLGTPFFIYLVARMRWRLQP